MRLTAVRLTNYRAYQTETTIEIDPLTMIVGRNDAGKSSVLEALDIFFNDASIDADDLCKRGQANDIKISCVFDCLPESLVIDNQHPTTLQDEYLLRTDGQLEITKTYSCANSGKGKVKSIAAIANHPGTAGIDDLLSLKITDLRTRCQGRAVDLAGRNQTIKADLRSALWTQANNLALAQRPVELMKEDAKELADLIQTHFPVYALFKSDRPSTDQDAEAQDPMKLAIKEVIRGRETDLAHIVADVERELQIVANKTVEKIAEMSPALAKELTPTTKTKNWDSLFSVSLTADDAIPLNKRGSGTRRLVLLNFFRARAEDDAKDRSNAIYAIEEPETSQHPDHQIMLLEAFRDMVAAGKAQVILTTHTPNLARRIDQANIRFIQVGPEGPTVHRGTDQGIAEAIVRTLGLLTNHDVKAFVGVEGPHDEIFICQLSRILSIDEPDIDDLDAAQKSCRLIFIPLGGSNLDVWSARLNGLGIREFYITDRDNAPPQRAKYQDAVDNWNQAGAIAWITTKRELENYIHPDAIRQTFAQYTGDGADHFEDVPLECAKSHHQCPPAIRQWHEMNEEDRDRKVSRMKRRLNRECVQAMTPARLTEIDPQGELRDWLRTITLAIRQRA